MSNLDGNLAVSVSTDAPPVGAQGFGTVLCVVEMTTVELTAFGSRYKTYSSAKEANDDASLTSAGKAMVSAAFSQVQKPKQVAVGVHEENDSDYSAALVAIDAVNSDFYGVCIQSRTKADQVSAATWVEANNRYALFQSSAAEVIDPADSTDIASTLMDASRARSQVIYHATDSEYADVASLAYFLAIDPDEASTIQSYQALSGVAVDTLTSTQRNAVLAKNATVYLTLKGKPSTYGGVMASGLKSDVRITLDWLTSRVQEAQAQALLNATARGSKIPFTDEGFVTFEALTFEILQRGEAAGHFEVGSSFVNIPKRSEVANADALSRTLRYDFGSQLAGAVETVSADGTVSVDSDLIDNLAGR